MSVLTSRCLTCLLMLCALLPLCSCVHEWPDEASDYNVTLTISHNQEWTVLEHNELKTRNDDSHKALYIYKVFNRGETAAPVMTFSELRDDLTLAPFSKNLRLPAGQWDIYIWQEFASDSRDTYHDTDDIENITYRLPYLGDSDNRDAFEAVINIDVESSIKADYALQRDVVMQRPMAKYVFIATDFQKFYDETLKKAHGNTLYQRPWGDLNMAQKEELLKGYSIVALYPFYMPAVYNMATSRVTDSWSDMNYEAALRPYGNTEAQLAMDYVMINHKESSCQVQLALKDPDGRLTPLSGVINVPMKRGQVTYVRGEFLTNTMGSGLDINFEFSGDINIKL